MKTKKSNKIPKFPKKLPGTFWGIVPFFNPAKYKNKIKNYRKFRESSKKQGLKLLTVELGFDNKFELTKNDADILIQINGSEKNIMWQKERLLNIGLKHLPKDCDKIAWLDCDIIFENDDWIKETSKLLEKYIVVQPFDKVVLLPKNKNPKNFPSSEIENKIIKGFNEGKYNINFASYYNEVKDKKLVLKNLKYHVGFAWCIRRKALKNNFYDRCILDGGDRVIAESFLAGKRGQFWQTSKFLERDIKKWQIQTYKNVLGSISYVKGTIHHLWHGSIENREYKTRQKILKKFDFNPRTDIKLDRVNCWVWASNKPHLHKQVKEYFSFRKEEESFLNLQKLMIYKTLIKFLEKKNEQ